MMMIMIMMMLLLLMDVGIMGEVRNDGEVAA